MGRFEVRKLTAGNVDEVTSVFIELLKTKGMKSGSARYLPLVNTINHVCKLNAQTALIQKDVQDPDFLAEHAAYYSKWTYKVPRYCYRVHFFSLPAQSDNPLEIIDQMQGQEGSYIGFVTLRPISVSPQAATILKATESPRECFILSKDAFTVNIAGQSFIVRGTPFMQQDNAVGACAQASIWMALRTLRRKEGVSAFSPAQITNAATRFYVKGRTLPNRGGLAIEQVTEAIRAAGYSPHMIPLRDMSKKSDMESILEARKSLYPYIESGIPVLLIMFREGMEGHAVLLIGHGWNTSPATNIFNGKITLTSTGAEINIIDASTWVEPLYIHNDNTGPYIPLHNEDKETYSLADAAFAIPFLQPDIFVDAEEAKLTCLKLLTDSLGDSDDSASADGEKAREIKLTNIVTRTYLQDRSEFRSSVVNSDMSKDVKDYYRNKWLPRRVWVTEINMLDGYSESPEKKSVRIGEIVLDPSSEPEDGCFLTIHLGEDLLANGAKGMGVIIDRDAFMGDIEAFQVDGSHYSPLVREG